MPGPRSPFVVSFLLALAAVLATGAGAHWNARAVAAATNWVSHTHEVQASLEGVLSLLKDAETGQRGYLLTGRDTYLAPYRTAVQQLDHRLGELQRLTADNAAQQRRLGQLRGLAVERLAISEEAVRLRQAGQAQAALDVVTSGRGLQTMDAARATVADMRDEEGRLLAERMDRVHAVSRRSAIMAVATTALVLALLTTVFLTARGAARRVHRSREWLEVTLRSIGDAVIATDTRGQVCFMNPVAQRMTGWTEGDARGQSLEQVFHILSEDRRQPVRHAAAKVLEAGAVVGLANHTLLVARDGAEYPIASSGAPIRDASGVVRGVVVTFADQSAERESRRRLEDSESRYRTLTEALPHMVWTADQNLVLTYVSRHWQAFTGWQDRTPSFHDWIELVHPDDRAGFMAAIGPPRARGEAHEAEFRLRRADGAWRRVLSRATPRVDDAGRLVQWVGTVTDIHDRWEAGEALRENQALTQAIIEGSTALVFAKDLQGRYFLSNRAWRDLVGVPAGQDRGLDDEQLFGVAEAHALRRVDQHVAGQGQPVVAQETATIDGQLRTFLSSKFPLRDASGAVYAVCGVSTDVTELKQAQQEVQRLNTELEARVAERTRQLSEANQELEAFSYTVSHDLRAPLRGLQGFAQAVAEDYGDRLDPEGRDYLGRIGGAARRMESLIQDLLDYGRLAREELPLKDIHLATAITEARERLAQDVQLRRAVLALQEPLPAVHAHPAVLVQVIANLLGNALKFVAPGATPQVRVRAEEQGGRVRVWVEDNGIGIKPEHQDRIFRVFERLHGQESYPGTGVGLAIVRKGCERMGGCCGVESQPGAGSRFWFELPAAKGTAP